MAYSYISEEEYDKLSMESQKLYTWCPDCEHYYAHKLGQCTHESLR